MLPVPEVLGSNPVSRISKPWCQVFEWSPPCLVMKGRDIEFESQHFNGLISILIFWKKCSHCWPKKNGQIVIVTCSWTFVVLFSDARVWMIPNSFPPNKWFFQLTIIMLSAANYEAQVWLFKISLTFNQDLGRFFVPKYLKCVPHKLIPFGPVNNCYVEEISSSMWRH